MYQLADEAKWYRLGIVGISPTKCLGSDTMELGDGWELFFSGVKPTPFAQAWVEILLNLQVTGSTDE